MLPLNLPLTLAKVSLQVAMNHLLTHCCAGLFNSIQEIYLIGTSEGNLIISGLFFKQLSLSSGPTS
jgi:hypothetical protein